jgi:LysM repeat protein
VKASDTLTSVAACIDMTPGELAKLNKLPQRLPLFPGQVLYVPARDAEADAEAAERRTSNSSIDEPTTSGDHLQCNSAADSGVDTDIERRKLKTFIFIYVLLCSN